VLPFEALRLRPCIVVHNPKFERLIISIDDSFEKMFNASEQPPPLSTKE
jgi:hypothetical protein